MNLLYIDLFCGAGGTSTGVNSARISGEQCATVIACVNHDKQEEHLRVSILHEYLANNVLLLLPVLITTRTLLLHTPPITLKRCTLRRIFVLSNYRHL